jgi:dTDP-4-dehydrorhamnose 3,5-epimerase-like enzyme
MSLSEKITIYERKLISDSRGWFLKIITGKEALLPNFTGEIYIISALVNECRANHYHLQANEWFTLVQGKVEMIIEDIDSKERMTIILNSNKPKTIFIPANVAHAFNNIGTIPYLLVTYTDKLYSPEDTVPYKLCK